MNREILFKGKRLDNGQWVEGNYGFFKSVNGNEKMHHITTEDGKAVRIDPSTLCQFTGITDKNGKKIWENDILFIIENMRTIVYQNGQCIKNNEWVNKSNFKVEFTPSGLMNTQRYANSPDITCEVIGNVFDNPELLT